MRPLLPYIFITTLISIGGCKAAQVESTPKPSVKQEYWPSVRDALTCLSESGPIISQHRGRSRETSAADNSMSGLKALRKNGFIMAEIDVTRLKDGTHILFHDGVWDDASTGRGPVASSTYIQSEKLLLRNKRGQLTSDRVLTLNELINWTDGQLYYEIDFKSSANERDVIDAFERAGLDDHIVLIAYSRKQALRLHKLSPKALIAAPVSKIGDIKAYEVSGLPKRNILAWLGTKDYNASLAEQLKRAGVLSSYGMMSPKYAKTLDYNNASMVVTDYANEAKAKTGIRQSDAKRLAACNLTP